MSVEKEKKDVETPADEHEYEGPSHPFWPSHVLNQTIIFYLVGGVLITLSVLLPFHLHEKADPMVTPEGIKPEWYFMAAYQLLKYVPKSLGVMMCGVAALGMVFWPFVDAVLERRFGARFYRKVGVLAVIVGVGLTLIGVASERYVTFRGQQYHINLLGIPEKVETPGTSAPEGTDNEAGAAEDYADEGNSH